MSQSVRESCASNSDGAATRCPSVIIVEDEPVVALALEEEFAAARFNVAGTFASCTETLNWLTSPARCCRPGSRSAGWPLPRTGARTEAAWRPLPDLVRCSAG